MDVGQMNIRTTQLPTGEYMAVDDDTYDCDCDQDGFFSTSPVGFGKTPELATLDLLECMEDAHA